MLLSPVPSSIILNDWKVLIMCGSKKNKVVVIGAGRVGESVVYTLAMSRTASEIVMVDVAVDRAKGSALDINHGLAFHKQVTVRQGDYSDCADAKVVIVTAGLARKPGQTRLDLAKSNVPAWSRVTIAGMPLMEYCDKNGIDIRPKMQRIAEETNKAGGTVIALKGATYLGIAMNTSRIVDAILEDEKTVLPVSHVLEGEIFGIKDVSVSFPCVVDADGIKKMLDMNYSEDEEKAIVASANTLRAFTQQALNM